MKCCFTTDQRAEGKQKHEYEDKIKMILVNREAHTAELVVAMILSSTEVVCLLIFIRKVCIHSQGLPELIAAPGWQQYPKCLLPSLASHSLGLDFSLWLSEGMKVGFTFMLNSCIP